MIKFGVSIWSCYGLRCVVRKLAVVMIAGVDGGGKTTSLGKLACRLKKAGAKGKSAHCDKDSKGL